MYAAGENPYHVSAADLPCQWLDAISPIWRDTPAPYGPLFVVLAGAAVAVGGSLWASIALLRLVAVAGVGLVAGGALIGLAVAVKATAAIVLPFAALAAIAGPYRLRALIRDGGPVVGGALAAVLAVTLGSGLGFGWVGGLSRSGDSVQWSSPSTAVGLTIGYAGDLFGVDIHAVPGVRLAGMAVLAVALVVLWWRARRGDPLCAAGVALVATVVLGPVFHLWYATWPLAVIAATAVDARRPRVSARHWPSWYCRMEPG